MIEYEGNQTLIGASHTWCFLWTCYIIFHVKLFISNFFFFFQEWKGELSVWTYRPHATAQFLLSIMWSDTRISTTKPNHVVDIHLKYSNSIDTFNPSNSYVYLTNTTLIRGLIFVICSQRTSVSINEMLWEWVIIFSCPSFSISKAKKFL